MKALVKHIILIIPFIVLMSSCSGKESEEREPVSGEVEFTISSKNWTYISLEEGVVKGTGAFGDEASDASWASRDDWDIAICDTLIRTNGGTSGIGRGALSDVSSQNLVPDSYQEIW
ncbi:MAG: HmuY family protein [Bacteroidales bacterium]|nr:HmuY family protein [Bacteroidales bacterium]